MASSNIALNASASTGGGVATDGNTTTWQHVKINLTQTVYTGWPYVAHTLDAATDQVRQVVVLTGKNAVTDDLRFYDGVDIAPIAGTLLTIH